MSTLKVDAIRHNSATSDAITTAADGTCTAKLTSIGGGGLSHRNLLINGAMNIAQRYTSSTSHPAYGADRFRWGFGNHSAGTVTASQQSLTSSDTPYTLGFRQYTRLALGQAGTAAANTYINLTYKAEAQDIANSGWDYTSASSYITVSFWFKCSTNQTFYAECKTVDGTAQSYVFSFTASGNNTWTKITKTIPGNSNLQIDNDANAGFDIRWYLFYGTDYTNNKTLNSWSAYSGSNILPDMASTWLTAGASTFDVTGVQVEVGDTVTTFEHRSYQDEFLRCCRYYYKLERRFTAAGRGAGSSAYLASVSTPVPLRAQPTLGTGTNSSSESFSIRVYKYDGISDSSATPTVGTGGWAAGNNHITIYQGSHSVVDDRVLNIYMGGGYIDFNSEL